MAQAIDMSAIEQALNGFTIPPQPEILQHIQQQLDAPEPNIKRIATLINLDIGIAGFTLKVVNSAFFGLRHKITSVEHACKFLGVNRVLKLVRSVLLRFTLAEGQDDKFSLKLWASALHTANIAMTLAKHFNLPQTLQDDCYSLGLFHNAGIALIHPQAAHYEQIMQQGLLAQFGYSEIEEQHFKTCHEVLGYLIAESWGLTPELCNVIAYHHSPQLMLESDSDIEKQLFALLKLAEHFSGESRHLFDLSLDPEWEQHKGAILEVLDVEPLQLPELAELLHRQQIHTIYSV
ncbi:HDOD domain-containing protein [Rheinheimera baltica]|uniref:HDOD domain-containing protein n=1 Tax=Rheinheimera baltica TaxID=67576 RepID=A0ABT9I1Q0_9GAMM|nr:HDOD domain-containing protein [Rheinheimera baltica]MDP5137315.1 HDOD domain-containing protein [Rheinheimera baltica]MDP5144257.1 HDOD domain-containing protein [Rheinheimera baltica]MDP5151525.1 HDOD domain-containing protein [Rheinheimera baltica]MDP5188445.1 HDOD domain-containing protein [Rheinheimera baltica]